MFQKGSIIDTEPKGTLGIVVLSDNAPAKVVTTWPWQYDEPAVYVMQSQC